MFPCNATAALKQAIGRHRHTGLSAARRQYTCCFSRIIHKDSKDIFKPHPILYNKSRCGLVVMTPPVYPDRSIALRQLDRGRTRPILTTPRRSTGVMSCSSLATLGPLVERGVRTSPSATSFFWHLAFLSGGDDRQCFCSVEEQLRAGAWLHETKTRLRIA